jgi:DNA-binding transcriptional MocR family regulator
MRWEEQFAKRASRITSSDIRELLKLLGRPDIISFAGGIPDPSLFPVDDIAAAHARILGDSASSKAALQYSISEGHLPLREWIAGYMSTKGVACTPDNILITNGSQQALDFLAKLFVDPGDTILVDRPTYLGALQAFSAYEPRYGVLPMDDDRTTSGATRPKLAYVVSEFSNPSGRSLTRAQREHLLDAAAQQGFPIIEDGAYELLRYEGEAPPSLLALSAARSGGIENGPVLYCGTFSKTIAPGLRLGWIAAPREVIRKLVLIKQGADLNTGALAQMVLSEVAGTMMSRLEAIRSCYRVRRDAMLAALSESMPAGVAWTRPAGGMFVWLTLTEPVDTAALLTEAIARGVAFVPGKAFFADGTGRNTLRLSFSQATPEQIAVGIARLGSLVHVTARTNARPAVTGSAA